MLLDLKVIVVVPAFEEEARVGRVIRTMPAEVDHVVVVDDASRDGTREAARAVGDARVEVVEHCRNRGVGGAIASGYLRAQDLAGDAPAAFVVMAGDGQMDPVDLPTLVRPIAEGRADYVKGCRFDWPGARAEMPLTRWVGGKGFSILTSRAIHQPIRDSQCGYTALASGACRKLDLAGLWPGYGYPNDLLGQLTARGLRIVEVPVRPIYAGETSRLRLRHLPAVAGLVARAWVRRVAAERRRVSGGT